MAYKVSRATVTDLQLPEEIFSSLPGQAQAYIRFSRIESIHWKRRIDSEERIVDLIEKFTFGPVRKARD